MRVISKLVACAVVLTLGTWCVPVHAASPAGGTLSKTKKKLTWTGTFALSEPTLIEGCVSGDAGICDHFALKLNLGEGATVKVSIPGQTATDMDLIVYDPSGAIVGSSGEVPGSGEVVEFKHRSRHRNKAYTVEVKPFLVAPGTTYKGTAAVLVLGAK